MDKPGSVHHILATGQNRCYDGQGREMACNGSGQDGDFRIGMPWPKERFLLNNETFVDQLTGLTWPRDANIATYPVTWPEALQWIEQLNRDQYLGRQDWRLPNRNALRSLISYQARKPALPPELPAKNIFLGWYWTSTTAAIHPAYAWSIHLEGARMFYGRKDQGQLFWPVCGTGNGLLATTGQRQCFDARGTAIPCAGSGQDGDFQHGAPWPLPRFTDFCQTVQDRLTGLVWARQPLDTEPVTWPEALAVVNELNHDSRGAGSRWRLPSINELASLVDCSQHTPALPPLHPFQVVRDGYWSSTTSFFETDWAWVLYLNKGACGVGHKPGRTFYVWPVR